MEPVDKQERRIHELMEFMSKHGASAAVQQEILSSVVDKYAKDFMLSTVEVTIKNLGKPHERH